MKLSTSIKVVNISFILFALIFSLRTSAGLINFETTASGAPPTDNGIINVGDAFMADDVSVSFGFDTTGDGNVDCHGVFEEIGGGRENRNSGFMSSYGDKYDRAATGFAPLLGRFFLRQEDAYEPFGTFHITYDAENPVTSASGEIWDIDGHNNNTERFFVEAFNGTESLASMFSPLGSNHGRNSLDGKPWAFGFHDLSDITRIEITFTGSKDSGIGLAFNNFSPIEDVSEQINSVPEPSTLAIFLLGIMGVASRRLKA